jgi:hypothetical protein
MQIVGQRCQPENDNELRKYFGGLVGFGRACAPVRCTHPSFRAHKHAKRAQPPIGASLLPQKFKKINYFQKQNASLQAQTRAARDVYLSTGLSRTLLSYVAPY